MTKPGRVAVALSVALALAAACDSGQEPDLRPTLTLEGPAVAAVADPMTVTVTTSDDRALEGLQVDWGDGTVDSLALSGTSATPELQHAFAALGSYDVRATVSAAGDQTATGSLTIDVGAATVVIEPDADTINALGFTTSFVARGYDAHGAELPGFEAQWETLNAGVAAVGPDGLVTAQARGEARIRAVSGPAADTVRVLVRQVPRAVVITAPDTMGVRTAATASAILADSNGVSIFDGTEFTWSSTAPEVVTVDAAGALTGVGEGTAGIVATGGGLVDTVAVEVNLTILVSRTPAVDENAELFTMTRYGTALRRITNDRFSDMSPTWSPDRRRIAFLTTRTPGGVIVLMDEDGANVEELPTPLARVSGLAWSPDGTRIAFEGYAEWEGTADLYLINVDGTGLTRITADTAAEESPAWSPDGSRIAFVQAANIEADIVTMDPDGSNRINLTGGVIGRDFSPAWSPDGSEIAFSSTRFDTESIYRMDADGGNVREISTYFTLDLDWSPDGRFLAFSSDDDGQRDLYVVPVDGGDVVRLTHDANFEQDVGWR